MLGQSFDMFQEDLPSRASQSRGKVSDPQIPLSSLLSLALRRGHPNCVPVLVTPSFSDRSGNCLLISLLSHQPCGFNLPHFVLQSCAPPLPPSQGARKDVMKNTRGGLGSLSASCSSLRNFNSRYSFLHFSLIIDLVA